MEQYHEDTSDRRVHRPLDLPMTSELPLRMTLSSKRYTSPGDFPSSKTSSRSKTGFSIHWAELSLVQFNGVVVAIAEGASVGGILRISEGEDSTIVGKKLGMPEVESVGMRVGRRLGKSEGGFDEIVGADDGCVDGD